MTSNNISFERDKLLIQVELFIIKCNRKKSDFRPKYGMYN